MAYLVLIVVIASGVGCEKQSETVTEAKSEKAGTPISPDEAKTLLDQHTSGETNSDSKKE